MKLSKLSLAAIVALGLGSSAFAADTLADAFKNGKVSGALQAYYFDKDDGTTDDSILDLGVDLSYVTDSYKGATVGFTFQGTSAPDAPDTAIFNGDMYGSGAVLSEAYLAYTLSNTTIKAGRQYVATPLVGSSGSRMTRESFQGVLVLNTDLPNTTLGFGYVNKFQTRTSNYKLNGAAAATGPVNEIGQFSDVVAVAGVGYYTVKDAWTVLAINSSLPNTTLIGQYASVNDIAHTGGDVTAYHLEASYAAKTDMANFTLGGQYMSSSADAVLGALDGNTFALKVNAAMDNGFDATLAYSANDNKNITVAGLGNGADNVYTGAIIAGGTYAADESVVMGDVSYDFAKAGVAGLKANLRYSAIDTGAANKDRDIIGVQASYAFAGELKGLGMTVQYEDTSVDNATTDSSELRVKFDYKF